MYRQFPANNVITEDHSRMFAIGAQTKGNNAEKRKQFSTYSTHLTLHFGGKSRGSWHFFCLFLLMFLFFSRIVLSRLYYALICSFSGLVVDAPKKEWNRNFAWYLIESVNRVFAGLSKIGMIAYQYELLLVPNRTPYNHLFNNASHFYLTIVSSSRIEWMRRNANETSWSGMKI